MVDILKNLNFSVDDFDGLENVEKFLDYISKSEIEFNNEVQSICRELLEDGEKRRSSKSENQKSLESISKHFFKNDFENLKIKSEKILSEAESDETRKITNDNRKFMEYFFATIFLGKRVRFFVEISEMTQDETQLLEKYRGLQTLRVIWKLENKIYSDKHVQEVARANLLLIDAYGLVGLENVRIKNVNYDALLSENISKDSSVDEKELLEAVKAHIKFSGNLRFRENFETVMKNYKKLPTDYEFTRISHLFIESLVNGWKHDCFKVTLDFVKKENNDELQEFLNSMNNADKIDKVPYIFKTENHKLLMPNRNLLPSNVEIQALNELTEFVNLNVLKQSETLALESKFWSTLVEALRFGKHSDFEALVSRLGFHKVERSPRGFTAMLKNINDMESSAQVSDLKNVALKLIQKEVRPLLMKNFNVIAEYVKPLECEVVTETGRRILECSGKNITLRDIKQNCDKHSPPVNELRVVGADVLHVSDSIKYAGMNIFVLAREIRIEDNVALDLSGSDTMTNENPGKRKGNDGSDGFAGQSGGNVAIIAEKVTNGSQLTIESNGGSGGNGQDGGNGKDGRDGEKPSLEMLSNPDMAFTEKIFEDVNKGYRFLDGNETSTYIKYRNKRGSIMSSLEYTNIWKTERIVLTESVNGEVGERGGLGGLGGEGGSVGDIYVNKNHGFFYRTNAGKLGNNGEGGLSGKQGANGEDVAVYHKTNAGMERFTSENDSRLEVASDSNGWVWMRQWDAYAKVRKAQGGRPPVSTYQFRNTQTAIRQRQQQAVAQKQPPVLWQELMQKYSDKLNVGLEQTKNQEFAKLKVRDENQETKVNVKVKTLVPAKNETGSVLVDDKTRVQEKLPDPGLSYEDCLKVFESGKDLDECLKALTNVEALTAGQLEKLLELIEKLKKTHTSQENKSKMNKKKYQDLVKKCVTNYDEIFYESSLLKKCHESLKKFEENKSKKVQNIENALKDQLSPSELDELYQQSLSREWAKDEFIGKIENNKFLKALYELLGKQKDSTFDWESYLKDELIYDEGFNYELQNNSTSILLFLSNTEDLSSKQKVKLLEKIFSQKYKMAISSEVTGKIKTKDSMPLNDREIIPYLNISETFMSDISNAALGRFENFFNKNWKQNMKISNDYIRNLLKDLELNSEQLLEPFEEFLESEKETSTEISEFFDDFQNLNELDIFSRIDLDREIYELEESIKSKCYDFQNNIIRKMKLIMMKKNPKVIETFEKALIDVDNAIPAAWSFLAKVFNADIAIYELDEFGSLELDKSCEGLTGAAKKLRVIELEGYDFRTIEENTEEVKMHGERKAEELKCKQILEELRSLKSPSEISDYSKKNKLEKLELSKAQYQENAELGQIILNLCSNLDVNDKKALETSLINLPWDAGIVLESISLKFLADGVHISNAELSQILETILTFVTNGRAFFHIFAMEMFSRSQKQWLPALIIRQIEDKCCEISDSWKKDQLKIMSEINQRKVIHLFSQKLFNTEEKLKLDVLTEIIGMFSSYTIETLDFIQNLDLNSWKFAIIDQYWKSRARMMFRYPDAYEKTVITASFHLSKLQSQYDLQTVKQLMDVLEQKKKEMTSEYSIIILRAFSIGEVYINSAVLEDLSKSTVRGFIDKMKGTLKDGQRSADDLIDNIKRAPGATKLELEAIRSIMHQLPNIRCSKLDKQIRDFTFTDVQTWRKTVFNLNTTDFSETLAVVLRVFTLITTFTMRHAQTISILLFWKSSGSVLSQISTGEGKSWIAVVFAILKVIYGYKVDVITSSNLLATRDATDEEKIKAFDIFGITVGHNCDENVENRKIVYSKKDVIYGSLGNFQRDFLLDKFFGENITASRRKNCVIIDEVDSMLLDKGNNILYLSHDLPDMQELESIYVFIWQWINQPCENDEHQKTIIDVKNIRAVVLNEIWGVLKLDQMDSMCGDDDNHQIIWNKLLYSKWIDDEGRILIESHEITKSALKLVLPNVDEEVLLRIYFFMTEQKSRFKMIKFPKYLEPFVLLHLDKWIKSAIRALVMEDERQYIIDSLSREITSSPDPEPIILDLNTGADMQNSQWDEALHQFLELKHGCKLKLQSLKSVFISNVSYLKLYENLYGMSGTVIGSNQEREKVLQIHDVDFVIVPAHKPKMFYEEDSILCENTNDWFDQIYKTVEHVASSRAILVICETIKEVNEISQRLSTIKSIRLTVFRREADAMKGNIAKLQVGQVIVATNLAGRGMDLKLSDEVSHVGGLHVLVTNLPPNMRVEQQAFGRAARAGDRGSGQLCVNINGPVVPVIELKQHRDNQEINRLEEIYKYYVNFIKVEEKFFDTFTIQYTTQQHDSSATNEELNIFKQSFLNNWSFWLDESSLKINGKNQDALMSSLAKFMKKNDSKKIDWSSPDINKTSKIQYVINNKSSGDIKILEDNITKDPEGSIVENYYKFYLMSKEMKKTGTEHDCLVQSLNDKQEKLLKKLLRMFEKSKDDRFMRCEMMKPFVERSKRTILQINGLNDQRNIYSQLDDIFIDSIDNIMGRKVYPEMFEDILIGKTALCEEFVEFLTKIGVVTEPKIASEIDISNFESMAKRNLIHSSTLSNFIMRHEGESINLKTFASAIEENINAPSREHFWEELIEKGILEKEVEFYVFTKNILDDVDPSLQQHLEKMKKVELKRSKPNEIFIYDPDSSKEEDVYLIFESSELKSIHDSNKFEALKKDGCLTTNKKANVNVSNAEKYKFNEILEPKNLRECNISEKAVKEILDILVNSELIVKTLGFDSFKLVKPFEKFDQIDLGKYTVFLETVREVLSRKFCYQIALQKICENIKTNVETNDVKTDVVIQLPSNPHMIILSELLSNYLIEPARINSELSGDMKKTLRMEVHMSNRLSHAELEKIVSSCTLHNGRVEDVINELSSKKLIKKSGDYYEVLDFKRNVFTLNSQYKNVETTLRVKLQNRRALFVNRDDIAEKLEEWVSTLRRDDIECPEMILKPLSEIAESLNATDEFKAYFNSGFTMVIKIEEKQFSLQVTLRFLAIFFIGLVQIVVGAVIAVLSCGTLSMVGNALIGEGIGDIIFASTSYASGHFTWDDYGKHKAISLAITVVTCGVGAYMARGKDAAGLGYKLFGNALTTNGKEVAKLTGKALIRYVGKKAIAKEVFKKIVYSLSKAAIEYGTSYVVDKILEKTLFDAIKGLASTFTVNVKSKLDKPEVLKLLKSLYEMIGKDKLFGTVEKTVLEAIKSQERERETEFKILWIVEKLADKMSSSDSNKSKFVKRIVEAISILHDFTLIGRVFDYTRMIIEEIVKTLTSLKDSLKANESFENTEKWEDVQDELVDVIADPIQNDIASLINAKITEPLLNLAADKLVGYATSSAKNLVNYGMAKAQKWDYKKSMKVLKSLEGNENLDMSQAYLKIKHTNKLMKLMQNTRSPSLMAQLIRENTQMNMVGVHAATIVIPDILKKLNNKPRNIQVKVHQENGDVHTYGVAGDIEINLKLKDNQFVNEAKGVKGNDCLFYALKHHIPELKTKTSHEFRELLANEIETGEDIHSVIREGWHQNTLRKGAYGGSIDATNYPPVQAYLQSVDKYRPRSPTDPPNRRETDLNHTGGTFSQVNQKFTKSTPKDSKVALIEVNHIPPDNCYPPAFRSLKFDNKRGKMPALAMINEHHKDLKATGTSTDAKNYRERLRKKIQGGDIYGATKESLEDIRGTGAKLGIAFDKEGVKRVLNAHVAAKTLTLKEADGLKAHFAIP